MWNACGCDPSVLPFKGGNPLLCGYLHYVVGYSHWLFVGVGKNLWLMVLYVHSLLINHLKVIWLVLSMHMND